ncbi:MAG: fluoride efflux transporter CrcB [Hyphomicrobiaceae bacterium]
MQFFLLACAGGALGAGARYLVNLATLRWVGLDVPWATFAVNVVGSLLMGAVVAYLFLRMPEAVGLRTFLATGVLGGLTTFSAFSLDVLTMLERGAFAPALLYVLSSVVLSILSCLVGYWTMRAVLL